LYYRLNVFPIRIPSLRERREDIPLLIDHFTQKYARRMNRQIDTIPESTLQKLQRWSWPGNVRELENLMERSVILTCNRTLSVSLTDKMNSGIDASTVVSNFEEQQRILEVLRETSGRISGPNGAAFKLGIKRSTLLDRMKKFGIDAREVRNSATYATV
jgi:transcriptional regulator with GAF, ATPase, and Fis domain